MLEEDFPRRRGGGVMARKISKAGGGLGFYKQEGPLANKGCERTQALKVILPAKRTADGEQAQEQGSRGELLQ